MDSFLQQAESIDVGQRLRLLRDERNISMRSLAKASGLSANALSMIERGLTSPSVSTLTKLAHAMQVPVTAFFRTDPEKKKVVLCRAGERTRMAFQRGLWEGLGGEFFAGRMEPFLITLETGANSGTHEILHSGSEFVYCLRGKLEYTVDGTVYSLEAGDTLIFAAQLPHTWRNPGPNVVNAIILFSSFEDGDRPGEFHTVYGTVS
jgi:transcriptional regulator with XRE-family HTH domain